MEDNRPKVLVTGGAGFIGSHVVDGLVKMDAIVVVVDNLSTGKVENLNRRALFYEQSVEDKDVMDIIFRTHNFDYVIHLAAQTSVPDSVANPFYDEEVNIRGTLNLLELSEKYKVRKFIFSSTAAVYGDTPSIPTSEDSCPMPNSPYAISKLAAEHYIKFFSDQYDIKFSILRFSNVYGPRQVPKGEAGVVAIFTERMLNNEDVFIYGDGEQVRDFIYVGDLMLAILSTLMKGDNEVLNISTGKGITINQLFDIMKNAAEYMKDPIYKPPREGDIKISILSNEKAKKVLDWKPQTPIEKGVIETFEWYRASESKDNA